MKFPLVIKYRGIDELQYISDKASLFDFQIGLQCNQDLLIDACGCLLQLTNHNKLVETERLTLSEFEELLKKHSLVTNTCCVAKIKD